ncbi:MAG TPA: ABC transporter ATP-binding protein [Candidatus Nanoarchaeia archaeon]|nr:ABC transporter ATP-binding protein [Candidatus Nanoarchaeia archaeon]
MLLELKEVTQEFRKRKILEDVQLSVEEGDFLGVIGSSGSGKTTLLNIITGFLEPTEGEVLYHGRATEKPQNLPRNLARFKKDIGFAPQHSSFYPKLTVQENLLHFGRLYGIRPDTLQHNIRNLLEATHLWDHQEKLGEELSGGMQKRLDISCSLVHNPKMLILDEPTADLDPILQEEITALLQAINRQGITIVLASHHLDSVERMCNKIAIVHKGKVGHGLLDEIRAPFAQDHFTITVRSQHKKEELIQQMKALPVKKIVDKGHSITIYPEHVESIMNSLLSIIQKEHLELHHLDVRKPSLMEIFEKIVRER